MGGGEEGARTGQGSCQVNGGSWSRARRERERMRTARVGNTAEQNNKNNRIPFITALQKSRSQETKILLARYARRKTSGVPAHLPSPLLQ